MTDAPEAQETADEVARAVMIENLRLALAENDLREFAFQPEAVLLDRQVPALKASIRLILSRLAVLEEERRLDGAAFHVMVSAIVPDSVTGGRSDLGIPAFGGFKPLAYARLQARKGG